MGKCSVDGCERIRKAKGFCSMHYHRYARHGDAATLKREPNNGWESPEYRVWAHIKQRCLNEKSKRYQDYGGRGISICDRWKDSFNAFCEDMGKKPFSAAQIDRIDNDGNYNPANCRWTTNVVNARNKRNTKLTAPIVSIIRELYSRDIRCVDIAKWFGLNQDHTWLVVHGKSWRNI